MEKAPDAFRTISEVAEEIEVPQHVLRFWESRFTQIRPMKRGGGRRYYRPDDVDLLRGVRHLLYGEGYTIRGVQRILRDEGPSFVQNVWRAGAEPPPPDLDDDEEDEDIEGATTDLRTEPDLLVFDPSSSRVQSTEERPSARREPSVATSAPAAKPSPPVIAEEDKRKLRSALSELIVCRQLIETALTAPVLVEPND